MYRGLLETAGGKSENSFALQFEQPHFITQGLLYEKHPRFAGGAFAPLLRRVDGFLPDSLRQSYPQREERAALVDGADEALNRVVAGIRKRGINHPYLKNFVLARCNPLTRARKTLPSFERAFSRLEESLKIRPGQAPPGGHCPGGRHDGGLIPRRQRAPLPGSAAASRLNPKPLRRGQRHLFAAGGAARYAF